MHHILINANVHGVYITTPNIDNKLVVWVDLHILYISVGTRRHFILYHRSHHHEEYGSKNYFWYITESNYLLCTMTEFFPQRH